MAAGAPDAGIKSVALVKVNTEWYEMNLYSNKAT